jgi:hypothetical protein
MFKFIAKLFKRQPTAAEREARLHNDLAALTLISMSLNAGKKK